MTTSPRDDAQAALAQIIALCCHWESMARGREASFDTLAAAFDEILGQAREAREALKDESRETFLAWADEHLSDLKHIVEVGRAK